MSDDVYKKLAKVLDTLPNGFPTTESGVELKLLEKVFTPEEADLFCDLRLTYETAEQISERTGRPLEGLDDVLKKMLDHGELLGASLGGTMIYKMVPWVLGIYEFQNKRIDKAFAKLNEEYAPVFMEQFFNGAPQLMQTLPVEEEIKVSQEALPYERVSNIIENSQSWAVADCVCKKEQGLLDNPCDRPLEVCMAFAPIPNAFEKSSEVRRSITKEEAYQLLKMAEDEGLVHLTSNIQNGHYYICNCCSCCCGVLDGINKLGIPAATVVNSNYFAEINAEDCTLCGTCADERCQVGAIEERIDSYYITREQCIGCGLCLSTCTGEAIRLERKDEKEIVTPPIDEATWFKQRGEKRGVDFSKFE
jgi:electron transport complex protein RnfB